MIRTLMIEGFPVCFGEGEKPSWYEGEKIDALGTFDNRPTITQTLNSSLGGVAETSDITFELVDSERGAFSNSRSLASIFRFLGENNVRIDGPDPLLSDETIIEPERTTHGTRKKLSLPGVSTQRVYPDPSEWDFPNSFAFETWHYQIAETTTAQVIYRKIGQHFLMTYNNPPTYNKTLFFGANPGGGGTANYIHNDNVSLNGWNHYLVSYNADTQVLDLWANNTLKQFTGVAPFSSLPAVAYTLFGRADTGSFTLKGDTARIRVWKRYLTATEAGDAYDGKPVDDTDIFFNSEWMAPWGDVIWDTSGNQNHIPKATGATWDTRSYLRGDELYLPSDTVRVQSVDSGAGELTVERKVYSCLEDGYNAYYASLPYNTADGSPYVCYADEDYPSHYPGRLVAYYEGGHTTKHLRYLGFMKTPNQRGKSWTFETTHILKPLRDGFSQIQTNITLADDGADSGWWIANPKFEATDASNSFQQTLTGEGLYTMSELINLFDGAGDSSWTAGQGWGFGNHQSTPPVAVISRNSKGLWDVCLENEAFGVLSPGSYVSAPNGLKNYGFIFGQDSGEAHMTVRTQADNVWNLDEAWLSATSRDDTKYYLYVRDVNYSTGELELVGPYDEDLNYLPGQTFGVMGDSAITLQTAPIVEATSLPRLIYSLMTSTGTATNGTHDRLAGWLGLGLPSELIDDSVLDLPQNWPIRCNLTDADIGVDMRFMGITLLWDSNLGQFTVKKVRPPGVNLATSEITNDDIGRDQRANVAWGQVAPISSFKFKTLNGTLTATAQIASMWPGAQLNEVSEETQTGVRIEDADLMIVDVVERLRWLSNYAPTITLELPGHTHQVGDQVTLTARNIAGAGQGKYHTDNIPCIVTGMGRGPNTDWIQLQLNTRDTQLIAAWVPSWEIESYSGAVCTLTKRDGLKIESRFDLPLTVQIIDSEGSVLDASRTIVSVTDEDTITLSAAPTYTQTLDMGIITLPDYTSAASADQEKYVWAANTSGIMSNSNAGKILT